MALLQSLKAIELKSVPLRQMHSIEYQIEMSISKSSKIMYSRALPASAKKPNIEMALILFISLEGQTNTIKISVMHARRTK